MTSHLKSVIFAAVLCLVCSALLTAAATGLRPYQAANEALDRQANLLKAVGLLPADHEYSTEEIRALYHRCIQPAALAGSGRIVAGTAEGGLPVFLYVVEERVQAYILPVNTRGLWGKINGYLAIEADGVTVAGFTVYRHQETPGLGGEIEQPWFQDNFKGKRIVADDGRLSPLAVAKGAAADSVPPARQAHHVDGISGATLTGDGINEFVLGDLQTYEPYFQTLRNQ